MRTPFAAGRPAFEVGWTPWTRAVAVVLAAIGVVVLVGLPFWATTTKGWGYDLLAYYDAAQRFVVSSSPYQPETLGGPFRPGPGGLYLYSPVIALLFVPLTALSFFDATLVWLVLRGVMVVATVWLLPVRREVRLALLGTFVLALPTLRDLNLGNVSLVVTFLAAVGWRWLDRPLGGIAIAAALFIRLPMGLIPAWWLLRRQWRPVAWTIAAGLLVLAVSLPFVGIGGWFDYVSVLRNLSEVTGVERNADFGSVALSLGMPAGIASLALYAGYAVALGAVLVSLRRDREVGYAVTVMATLLLAPLLWDHYLTLLLIPAALLADRGRLWALLLPLLGWLPLTLLPFVALVGLLLPLTLPGTADPGSDAVDEAQPVADLDTGRLDAAGA